MTATTREAHMPVENAGLLRRAFNFLGDPRHQAIIAIAVGLAAAESLIAISLDRAIFLGPAFSRFAQQYGGGVSGASTFEWLFGKEGYITIPSVYAGNIAIDYKVIGLMAKAAAGIKARIVSSAP